MGKGGSSGKVNIPAYQEPTPYSFNTPYGNAVFSNGAYNFTDTADATNQRNEMTALRNAIMRTIGVTGAEREKSLDTWKNTYFNEAKRLALPSAEQQLFDRGLGGSRFYQDQTNDLLQKLATQSVLEAENLRNQDEQTKMANLQGIEGIIGNDRANILSLLGLAQNDASQRNSLATNRWQSALPYATTYEEGKKGNGSTWGQIIGAGLGAMVGNPVMGAQIGGMLGGSYDASKGRQSADYGLGSLTGNQGFMDMLKPSTSGMNRATTGKSYTNSTFGGSGSIFGGPKLFN